MATATTTQLVLWYDQVGIQDVGLVGGKNASLGEMYRELSSQGVRIPNGFATTSEAYRFFMAESGLDERIMQILADLDTSDILNLRRRGHEVRQAILDTRLPIDLETAIAEAYGHLCEERGDMADVAVRSSATAEDLPNASFAGQQETYLNVRGASQLLDACHRCFASLFTDRAISYRVDMCEIPSNVIEATAFAELFDGFSIGSNDLTQLTLGVDRDSEIVAHIFSEQDPAVMASIASAIRAIKATDRKVGICGQAPSDYPGFAQFLLEQGIDSISLNPDAVIKTTLQIQEFERSLVKS